LPKPFERRCRQNQVSEPFQLDDQDGSHGVWRLAFGVWRFAMPIVPLPMVRCRAAELIPPLALAKADPAAETEAVL
jgi:hypothetical protein